MDALPPAMNGVVLPHWLVVRGRAVSGRRVSLLCARLLRARQCLLPALGRHRARSRALSRLDRAPRDRAPRITPGSCEPEGGRVSDYTRDEMMTVACGADAVGRLRVLRRHRAAECGLQPRASHARAGRRADLRVRHDRHAARGAAALDRRRRARRDGRLRRAAAGGVQLLPAGRARRRRVSRRRADRSLRQPQQHGDRPLRSARHAAARRGWRTGDRRACAADVRRHEGDAAQLRAALDFRTSAGFLDGSGARARSGATGAGRAR